MTESETEKLRAIATYQFGTGAGDALFPADEQRSIDYSSGGRPRQVHGPDGRIVSLGTDGRFTLGIEGGRRLQAALDAPRSRVVVGSESDPYVRDGRNAFAKFVRKVDPAIRPGDEVLVVTDEGLLAVGEAALSASECAAFETGVAVDVRESVA
ncbi:PUA domain-containing protein [Halococcoides cellulosivorans]|uniref:Pseudouridine synthase n=1 Tax=Halococcoides cellulosivorans TaxID=1679096 RepID=A0A2R4X4C7_9EURY|nr:PUA domain-containing protein [Halococcoides cellulosivorans]AWB28645.1 pseudouridine synthase [Halococcoides cellulosivorans]